jgi:hypothetical protein
LRQIDPYRQPIPTGISFWNLVATPDNFGSSGGCFSDKSHGVVTTNAMIYEEGAPMFKSREFHVFFSGDQSSSVPGFKGASDCQEDSPTFQSDFKKA